MRMTLTHNDYDGVSIVNDGNGANVTNLPVGDYSIYASIPLSINAGWLNLNVGVSSGVTNLGPLVSEQLTGSNGYTRLNLDTALRVTQTNTKIWVFMNNNVSGTMREKRVHAPESSWLVIIPDSSSSDAIRSRKSSGNDGLG